MKYQLCLRRLDWPPQCIYKRHGFLTGLAVAYLHVVEQTDVSLSFTRVVSLGGRRREAGSVKAVASSQWLCNSNPYSHRKCARKGQNMTELRIWLLALIDCRRLDTSKIKQSESKASQVHTKQTRHDSSPLPVASGCCCRLSTGRAYPRWFCDRVNTLPRNVRPACSGSVILLAAWKRQRRPGKGFLDELFRSNGQTKSCSRR